jgi:integrase
MAPLPAIREPLPCTSGALSPDLDAALRYAKAEKAPGTRRAYETDHGLFVAWCEAKGLSSNLPAAAETVAAFLAAEAQAGKRPSTLGRRLAAIRYFHKLAGHPTPTDAEAVKATLRGIRRSMGSAKLRKAPALAEHIKAMVAASPESLRGKRDRALVLLGFAGAFRRSELVALDVEDVSTTRLLSPPGYDFPRDHLGKERAPSKSNWMLAGIVPSSERPQRCHHRQGFARHRVQDSTSRFVDRTAC